MSIWNAVRARWRSWFEDPAPPLQAPDWATTIQLPAEASCTVTRADGGQGAPVRADDADLDLHYFAWLVDTRVDAARELSRAEQALLDALDATLVSPALRDDLLPRARSVVPQIMARLRDEDLSLRDLATRISRDPNLLVEVMRLANSAAYGKRDPVTDPLQALARLGTQGLRAAVAKVLLKPIFDERNNPLLAQTYERLWQQSELQADLCLALAAEGGVDPAEASLAGLMHNVGWTASFRVYDRSPQGGVAALRPAVSARFVRAASERREALFASLIQSWQVSRGLDELAAQILAQGYGRASSPLARVLYQADARACAGLLEPAGA